MSDILKYIDREGKLREFDADDRFGLDKPKLCGYPDCNQVTEPGYGRCEYHLKLDEELKNAKNRQGGA